jgi:hypothetical protein
MVIDDNSSVRKSLGSRRRCVSGEMRSVSHPSTKTIVFSHIGTVLPEGKVILVGTLLEEK